MINTHGGSLRIFAKRKSNKLKVNKSVTNIIKKENNAKIYSKKKHKQFSDSIFKLKND